MAASGLSGVRVRTSVHVGAKSYVYISSAVSRVFYEAIQHAGLDGAGYAQLQGTIERGLRTWITMRYLEAIHLEIIDSRTRLVRSRIDLSFSYVESNDDRHETDIARVRQTLSGTTRMDHSAYRVVVTLADGAPRITGWDEATLGSTDHLLQQDLSAVLNSPSGTVLVFREGFIEENRTHLASPPASGNTNPHNASQQATKEIGAGAEANKATTEAFNHLWRQLTARTDDPQVAAGGPIANLFASLIDDPLSDAEVLLALLDIKMRKYGLGVGAERMRADQLKHFRALVTDTALAVLLVNSVETGQPAIIRYLDKYMREQPDRLDAVAQLWAAVLRHRPHRRQAILALCRSLRALRELSDEPGEDARRIGAALARALPEKEHEPFKRDLNTVNPQQNPGQSDVSADVLLACLDAVSPVASRGDRAGTAYPITARRRLEKAEKAKWYRRAKPSGTDLPKPDAHHVMVYRIDGNYVLDNDRIASTDERVVQATQVSMVDMRRDAPVAVRLEIPSKDAASFEVLVTFTCTVTDAIAVVRGGVDAGQALWRHLKAHNRIFELGLDFPLSEIHAARRVVSAQVKAYLTVRPPTVPGMAVSIASVEMTRPELLSDFVKTTRVTDYEVRLAELQQVHERRIAARRQLNENRLANDQGDHDAQLTRRVRQSVQDEAVAQAEYEELLDGQAQQHERDEAAAAEHEQLLASKRSQFTRSEFALDMETIGNDPRRALMAAFADGRIEARELSEQLRQLDQVAQIEQAQRDGEDRTQLQADREDRLAEHEQNRNEREHADQLRALHQEREDRQRRKEAERLAEQQERQSQFELLKTMIAQGHFNNSDMQGERLLAKVMNLSQPEVADTETPSHSSDASPEQPEYEDRVPHPTSRHGDPASPISDPTNAGSTSVTGGLPPSNRIPEQDTGPRRVLVGQMPAQVRDGNEVSLIVHVARSASEASDTRSTPMKPWPIPADGSDVTIVVHAEAGLTPLGPGQQVIRVPTDSDSDPIRFAFRASGVNVCKAEVTAWAGGRYLAKLTFEVSVADRGPNLEPAMKTATVDHVHCEDGAVTLQVHHSDGRYTFQLHNNQCVYDPVMVTVDARADGTLDRALDTLRRFAKDVTPPAYTPAVAREWLRSVGVSLWNSIVPEAIREQYLQLHCHTKTFSIATGKDAIPWELLYPMTKAHDAGFLVNQFPVTRTVYNTDRSRKVNLGSARFVQAARSPANAYAEFQAIGRIVSPGIEPHLVTDLGDLLDLFTSGEAGLTHFACHATYRDDGSGAAISMCDGEFSPMMLATVKAKESLTANRPLVFINACRSAGTVPYFTQMMGWAQQFLGAGAGAFIGTLWDVRSSSAQTFAEVFYTNLMDGQTLGQAALRARIAIMDDMDPTWLAYTVYGDANALALQW